MLYAQTKITTSLLRLIGVGRIVLIFQYLLETGVQTYVYINCFVHTSQSTYRYTNSTKIFTIDYPVLRSNMRMNVDVEYIKIDRRAVQCA